MMPQRRITRKTSAAKQSEGQVGEKVLNIQSLFCKQKSKAKYA